MANRPTPGRKAFKDDLQSIESDIPRAYSARVLEFLKKNGYAVKLGRKLADKGRDNDRGMMVYINNVRKGHTVDWDVLAGFQQLVKEVKRATTLEPQDA
jgi:hypothetical protein